MKLASFDDLTLLKSETFAPFLEGDPVVVVGIASLEEGLDAGLHRHHGSGKRDELVVGDLLVMGLGVQVTELPDHRVHVLEVIIVLGFFDHVDPVITMELLALIQITHHLEKPV